jgi:RNA polymerase sigma factor (sigma-70 family)
MRSFDATHNPLDGGSIQVWDELVEAVAPASLLVLIDQRLGPALRSRYSAEDILQESLLHAWRDRGHCQWRGLRTFRAWLISIIEHRIYDIADYSGARKRGGRIAHRPLGDGGEPQRGGEGVVLMQSTTPSRIAVYREQAAAMSAALDELPTELAVIVRLRLLEQLPVSAIAEHLGIGESAVRHRLRKGAEMYSRRLQAALASRSGAIPPESAHNIKGDSSPPE